jgi:hypothetical protein
MIRRLADVITRVALGLALLAGTAACNAALNKREVVVHFSSTATSADHRGALAACTGIAPHTSPEPIVHNRFASTRIDDVRFRVDKANDGDLAKLYICLGKQPGVLGVSDPLDTTR